jgi:hypothetical protein
MSISKPRIVAVFLLSLSSLWSANRPRQVVRGEEADPPRNFRYLDGPTPPAWAARSMNSWAWAKASCLACNSAGGESRGQLV